MTTRSAVALWTLGLLCAGGALALVLSSDHDEDKLATLVLAIPLGVAFIAAGLIAWSRHPENRTGRLMAAVGFAWFLGALSEADAALPHTAGLLLSNLVFGPFVHLLLAYPAGRLESRLDRALAAFVYAFVTVLFVPVIALGSPESLGCESGCPQNLIAAETSDAVGSGVVFAWEVGGVLALLVVIGRLAVRWRAATPLRRRALTPVYATGACAIAVVVASLPLVHLADVPEEAISLVVLLALLAVPLSFLFGLLRRHLARSGAARLLLEVPDEPTPEEAQEGLRRALGDPGLKLALWHPETESYVDADGRPLALAPDTTTSATTRLEYEGRPVAALVHDPALLEEPERFAEVTAAARVALEKDRSLRALRASERRTRALLDAIPDLMFRISAEGRYLDYKAGDERDLYVPDVIGQSVADRLPREVAGTIMGAARRALAGEGPQVIEYELDFDGERRQYEGRVAASGRREFVLIVREITARKRAEEELTLERDLVRAVVDTVPTLMCGVDHEGRIVRFNSALERLSGFVDDETVRGRRFWEVFVDWEDAADFARSFRELVQGGLAEHEHAWITVSGDRATVAWTARWYLGEAGADRFLIAGTDVTERKRREGELRRLYEELETRHEALERQRDFLDAMANNIPSLLCLIDHEGRVVDRATNTAFERLLEYDPLDTGGHLFWERYVAPEQAQEVRERIERVLSGETVPEQDNEWLTSSGKRLQVAWTTIPLPPVDERTLFLVSGVDVSERRRQQEELRRQRDFLSVVGDATPSLLVLVDADGRIGYDAVNLSTRMLTGHAPEEVRGRPFWEVFAPPEASDRTRRLVRRAIARGDSPEHETTWLTKSGERLLVAWRCTKLPPLSDREVYLIAGTDITQRKRQEEELRTSRARLVEAGDAERRRLERNLHDGAQQRLVAISIALRLAKAKLETSAGEAEKLLESAAEELARALEELRELARGIHPAILTDRGLQPALVALASRSPVPVALDVPEERMPDPVEAAAYYVVSEALANVAKYAQASSVRVRVARRDTRVVVEVRDDGVGGADPSHGSGLRGLADRVSALDGRLDVESTVAAGTRVRAEIPLR